MPEAALVSLPAAVRLRDLLGWLPAALEPLGGGRNSRVLRVAGPEGQAAVLKVYHRHRGDARDRLGTEFGALAFCWEHGLRDIPRPLAADPQGGFALYEFIAGTPVPEPAAADLDQAAAFLARLYALGRLPAARELGLASEACFSFQALEANVHARFARLEAVAGAGPLAAFLDGELRPAWERLLADSRRACAAAAVPFDQELPAQRRTLSPSDFGFHNALRRGGRLVFFDFEYFGWDDPAKTLADLLLHPAMELPPAARRRLAEGVLAGLAAVPDLARRVRLAFPLYGIKWCLILLNEFLPEGLERRDFARPEGAGPDRQERQLAKARSKLRQVLDEHERFPHFQS